MDWEQDVESFLKYMENSSREASKVCGLSS